MSRFATGSFPTPAYLSRVMVVAACAALSSPAMQPQAIAQGSSSIPAGDAASIDAYVYVSSSPRANRIEINAYRAASNGKLTKVTGSPFPTSAAYGVSMTTNGKHLFLTNEIDIYSYAIAANGALRAVSSIDAQGFNQSDCGGPAALFSDRSGATLYDWDIYSDCANNAYQFFNAEASTGDLNYLGVTSNTTPIFEVPLSFTGNNKYAYGASCYHWYQEVFGFKRNRDGTLTDLNIAPAMPTSKAGQIYCPFLAAADAGNHVAVSMQALDSFSLQPTGRGQLATYTADGSGNLTTESSYANMPRIAVGSVTTIAMSPSGELLAVAGTGGLQVFHFNGASPITIYSGLLTSDEVDQVSWDNQNHLYGLGQAAGKLFVFTITPTRHSQVAGSPYTITNPGVLSVLAK
jgi:hypothetical protein